VYGSLWSPINLVAIFIQKNGWQKTSQVLDLLSSVFSASHVKSSHVQVQEYLISSESQKWAFFATRKWNKKKMEKVEKHSHFVSARMFGKTRWCEEWGVEN